MEIQDEFTQFNDPDFLKKAICTPNGRAFLDQTLGIVRGFISTLELELGKFREVEKSLSMALGAGGFLYEETAKIQH